MTCKNLRMLTPVLAAGLLLILLDIHGFAQGRKINGYIILNDGERVACHVFNTGNEESASFYEYVLPDSVKSHKMDLARIREFGIGNELKCVRSLILIDVSGDRIRREEEATKGPDLDEGHAYLKVLYEGPRASLYSFYDQGRTFYYYRVKESTIELLYYKRYYLEIASGHVEKIIEDNRYKEQLAEAFDLQDDVVRKLSYTNRSLVKTFEAVNRKESGGGRVIAGGVSNGIFRFRAVGGMNFHAFRLQNLEISNVVNFSSEQSLTGGLSAEYIFPYNKRRWGVFVEALYASYQTDYSVNSLDNDHTGYVAEYKALEFPAGISFQLPVARKSHIFVKAGYAPQVIRKSSSLRLNAPHEWKFSNAGAGVFAAGYRLGRFSAEYRYYTTRNITQHLYNRKSNFSQSSVLIGISLFQAGKE